MLKRNRGLSVCSLFSCRFKAEALARAFNHRLWPCTWAQRRPADDNDMLEDEEDEFFETSPSPVEDEEALCGRDCSAATEQGRNKLFELLKQHAGDDATEQFYDVCDYDHRDGAENGLFRNPADCQCSEDLVENATELSNSRQENVTGDIEPSSHDGAAQTLHDTPGNVKKSTNESTEYVNSDQACLCVPNCCATSELTYQACESLNGSQSDDTEDNQSNGEVVPSNGLASRTFSCANDKLDPSNKGTMVSQSLDILDQSNNSFLLESANNGESANSAGAIVATTNNDMAGFSKSCESHQTEPTQLRSEKEPGSCARSDSPANDESDSCANSGDLTCRELDPCGQPEVTADPESDSSAQRDASAGHESDSSARREVPEDQESDSCSYCDGPEDCEPGTGTEPGPQPDIEVTQAATRTSPDSGARPGGHDRALLKVFSEDRPAISRSTSLKTGKTPPGTPRAKKIVRFADVLGLDLEDVRTIIAGDLPNIPSSAYSDLVLADLPATDGRCATLDLQATACPRWEGGGGPTILYPQFQAPGQQPDFWDKVRAQGVCLEGVVVADWSVQCTCRVMNWGFSKKVAARYTVDRWATSHDISASFVPGSSRDGTDQFAFSIFLSRTNSSVELALRYEVNGNEYWDNYSGKNYRFGGNAGTSSVHTSETISPTWMHQFW